MQEVINLSADEQEGPPTTGAAEWAQAFVAPPVIHGRWVHRAVLGDLGRGQWTRRHRRIPLAIAPACVVTPTSADPANVSTTNLYLAACLNWSFVGQLRHALSFRSLTR